MFKNYNISFPKHSSFLTHKYAVRYWFHSPSSVHNLQAHVETFRKNPQTRNAPQLISVCGKQKRIDLAFNVYHVLVENKQRPDLFVFTSLIHACKSSGHFEKGILLWNDMIRYQVFPDKMLFHIILGMCAKFGKDPNVVQSMYTMINDKKFNFTLNTIDCTMLIQSFGNLGLLEEAFSVIHYMERNAIPLDAATFVELCKVCTKLSDAHRIYTKILHSQINLSGALGTTLIKMFGKCQSFQDARNVFDNISPKNTKIWNTMISVAASCGFHEEAVSLFYQMEGQGVNRDNFSYISLFKCFGNYGLAALGCKLHNHFKGSGIKPSIELENTLITMYGRLADMESAFRVFNSMQNQKDTVTLNSLLSGCVHNGYKLDAVNFFKEFTNNSAILPDATTYSLLFNVCGDLMLVQEGLKIEKDMLEVTFMEPVFLKNARMDMHTKFGFWDKVNYIFDNMKKNERDEISWTILLTSHAKRGNHDQVISLLNQMSHQNLKPNLVTFITILKALDKKASLPLVKYIEEYVKCNSSFTSSELITFQNTLIHAYARCGTLQNVKQLFATMNPKLPSLWCSLLSAYALQGSKEALEIFHEMKDQGVSLDQATYATLLGLCVKIGAVEEAKHIHEQLKNGLTSAEVEAALITMYADAGEMNAAVEIFSRSNNYKSPFLWNAMMSAHLHSSQPQKATHLFQQMQESGCKLDGTTFNIAITAFCNCGQPAKAQQIFEQHPAPDVVSYSALISGYIKQGYDNSAVVLFHRMVSAGLQPNHVTLSSVLSACANLAALNHGKQIHQYIIENNIEMSEKLQTSLMNMYLKCGLIAEAQKIFDSIAKMDVVAWNAIINAYGLFGKAKMAIQLFEQMVESGVTPTDVTFISLLNACSHGGLVQEATKYYGLMQKYNIHPTIKHQTCLVDTLARAGLLAEAEEFAMQVISSSPVIWVALLSACVRFGDATRVERIASKALEKDSTNAAVYVLLSNFYALQGQFEMQRKVWQMMVDNGIKKIPGESTVEIDGVVHTFVANDGTHPKMKEIEEELERLILEMKTYDYVPDTKFVQQNVTLHEKEHLLCRHSEKLAISYALISTPINSPIHIVKNLRVCEDCHKATKLISKIKKREIIVRDASRFHHFSEGKCSCNDYW